MKTPAKIAVILAVAIAVAAAFILKGSKSRNADEPSSAKLPKLLDLGSTTCTPCKMMTPILEELEKEYAGKMKVEFIDVWQNEDAGKKYAVEVIPTQIFFDANDKELFRHTGFIGKADILSKWNELGINLK